jgi:hypothetical protein
MDSSQGNYTAEQFDEALGKHYGIKDVKGLNRLKHNDLNHLSKAQKVSEGYKNGQYGFLAKESLNGFGMGAKAAIDASRATHFARAISFANPLSASSRDILRSSVGMASREQKIARQRAFGFMGKVKNLGSVAMTEGLGLGFLAMNAMGDGSPRDALTQVAEYGGMSMGWRLGKAVGGALTAPGGVSRGVGMIAGGALGGLAVLGAIEGTKALASDLTSSSSKIAGYARQISMKEYKIDPTNKTRQALTARQMALNKLARSGLNDRNQLLGNESLVLRGMM